MTIVHKKSDTENVLKAAWLRAIAVPGDSFNQAVRWDDREEFWKEHLTLTEEELRESNKTTDFLWWVSTEIEEDVVLHGIIEVLPPYQFKVIRSWKRVWP